MKQREYEDICVRETIDILRQAEKECAECHKTFIVLSASIWVYKLLRPQTNSFDYYCCYTHWIKHYKEREEKRQKRVQAYLAAMVIGKIKSNQRRRERRDSLR